MTIDPQIAALMAVPCVLGLVWLVRLEGRISLGEERYKELTADIQEIKQDVKVILHGTSGRP